MFVVRGIFFKRDIIFLRGPGPENSRVRRRLLSRFFFCCAQARSCHGSRQGAVLRFGVYSFCAFRAFSTVLLFLIHTSVSCRFRAKSLCFLKKFGKIELKTVNHGKKVDAVQQIAGVLSPNSCFTLVKFVDAGGLMSCRLGR